MISRPTLFDAPGGDTIQISETAAELRNIGVEVEIKLANEKINYHQFDLIHFFNMIRPNAIWPHIKKSKLPYVLSTIYVDYTVVDQYLRSKLLNRIIKIIGQDRGEYLKTIARNILNSEPIMDFDYLWMGHRKSVKRILNKASYLLPNSNSEWARIVKDYNPTSTGKIIPNGFPSNFKKSAFDPTIKSGVICVARIEPIKNQLNLIKAIQGTNIPLKIIGQAAPNHHNYFEECKRIATENVEFIGQLNQADLLDHYKKAKVHILPSWFETTGLSSLEAAAMGCNIIVSPYGDTKEYFEGAIFCEPDNVQSIKHSIEKALAMEWEPLLRNRVLMKYNWKIAAEMTHLVYQEVLNNHYD